MIGNFVDRKLFGWLEMNIFLQYCVPVVMLPMLVLFKYGRPRGYFADLIMFHVRSRIYGPGGRDEKNVVPYLIAPESL